MVILICRPLAEQALPLCPIPGLDPGGRHPADSGHVQRVLVVLGGHCSQPGLCLSHEWHHCSLPSLPSWYIPPHCLVLRNQATE